MGQCQADATAIYLAIHIFLVIEVAIALGILCLAIYERYWRIE